MSRLTMGDIELGDRFDGVIRQEPVDRQRIEAGENRAVMRLREKGRYALHSFGDRLDGTTVHVDAFHDRTGKEEVQMMSIGRRTERERTLGPFDGRRCD